MRLMGGPYRKCICRMGLPTQAIHTATHPAQQSDHEPQGTAVAHECLPTRTHAVHRAHTPPVGHRCREARGRDRGP